MAARTGRVRCKMRITKQLVIMLLRALPLAAALAASRHIPLRRAAHGLPEAPLLSLLAECATAEGLGVDSILRGLQLTWRAEPGLEYILQWTDDLQGSDWREVGSLLSLLPTEARFFGAEEPSTVGFYRIEKRRPMVLVTGQDGGVSYDFYIAKYEVTNAEFAVFLSSNPAYQYALWEDLGRAKIRRLDSKSQYVFVPLAGWEEHPVSEVTWEMAAAYCNWLSERDGLERVYDESSGWVPDITKNGYRLPTAEEWYKAAGWDPTREGVGGFWRYGCRTDTMRNTLANHADGGDPFGGMGWDPPSSHVVREPETTPVGYYNGHSYLLYRDGDRSYSFAAEDGRSYYGCYDLSGNVSEFVSLRNGDAWASGCMGSNWSQQPQEWNLADTFTVSFSLHADLWGFRIARTAVQAVGAD